MTREKEDQMDKNSSNNNQQQNQANQQEESPMSILEKRLAEINAKKNNSSEPAQQSNSNTSATNENKTEAQQPVSEKPEPAVPAAPAPVSESKPEPKENKEEKAEIAPENAPEIKPDLTTQEQEKEVAEHEEAMVEAQEELPAPDKPVSEATETEQPKAEVTQAEAEPESIITEPKQEEASAAKVEEKPEPAVETTKTETPVNAAASQETTASEEDEDEEHVEEKDYSSLSLSELRSELNQQLKESNAQKNSRTIMSLHRLYEEKVQAKREEALDKFVQEGNSADDFEYRLSKEDQDLESAFKQFRDNRVKSRRETEEQKIKNLHRKNELLNEIREITEAAETKKGMERLKEIQQEWKAIGNVPAGEAQELWNSYHALLDIFYNNRSIFYELKELDRKKNLDAKLQLIDRAEELVNLPSINESLQELRHLHEEWKNIGPVPNDQRDPIWDRFIQASEKVHERKREYLAQRQEVEAQNLVKKQELLNRIEPYANFNSDRINNWREKTDEIQKIKEEWDAAGLVPKANADEVNKKFWGTYKAFFHHKNQFFKSLDEQKLSNLKLKTELCEQAESLKDSDDWHNTKEKLIQLQKKWKTIGRVPDKYSDKIWQRFRSACNEFFDRRENAFKQRDNELEQQAAEKIAYCEELTNKLANSAKESGSMEEYNEILKKWNNMDAGNRVNNKVEEKFYKLMESYLDTVPALPYQEKNELLFQLQVNKLKSSPDANQKLYNKQQSIKKEIGLLENDIRTLRTNIEFFSKSKNADKLREEYEGRISEAQQRIEMLQHQLETIRE